MTIKDQLFQIIEDWQEAERGIYKYDEETDEEICLEDDIKDFLMKYFDKSQYTYDITAMFENSGVTVYSLSVAWIEDGKMQTILNEIIKRR